MHPRLAELVEYLSVQRAAVLQTAAAVPAERWAEPPAEGRWSVGQILAHLHRVETGVARLIVMRVSEARSNGHPAETERSSMLGALDGRGVMDRSVPVEAPARVSPSSDVDSAQVLTLLESSRTALLNVIRDADGLALGTIRHPHPVLGEIDLYQWILFVGQHERRHMSQLAEVTDALDAVPH